MIQTLCILTDAFFIALMGWCTVTDLRTRTVSNIAVLLILILGLGHTALIGISSSAWWPYPAGLLLSGPFYTAWLKGGMGAGDVKLLMGIGLYMGLWNTLTAFVLMLPVMVALTIYAGIRGKRTRSTIPFAPVLTFVAVGTVLMGYISF